MAAAELRTFTRLIFERLGMRSDDSEVLAEHLVWADLRGVPWLGVRKIPQYVARIRAGGTSATATPTVVHDEGAVALIDANDTWGQVVGAQGMKMAVRKAKSLGVAVVVVRNTTSAGMLGRLAMFAADEGMIGLAINNSPPLQPVWGAAEKVIGNQAFAIASPAGRHEPLLLDMATSSVTMARIHEYQASGEPLPPGVALSADGQPTVDPVAAMQGLLLPMGGHRGSGLALMWEVLTGVLAGGQRISTEVTMPDAYDRPQAVSLFLLVVNPGAFLAQSTFGSRVDTLAEQVHRAAPLPGVDRVRLPGERGYASAEQRRRDGVPIPADLVTQLRALGDELDVSWPG